MPNYLLSQPTADYMSTEPPAAPVAAPFTGAHALDGYDLDPTVGDPFTGPSLASKWTRRGYSAPAESYQQGKDATWLRIAEVGQVGGDGYYQPCPAGDWTIAMACMMHNGATPAHWGLGVVDALGTGVGLAFYHATPLSPLMQGIVTYTDTAGAFFLPWEGASSSPNVAHRMPASEEKVWLYLRKAGTNYYCAYSLDGETWSPEGGPLVWAGTPNRVAMLNVPLSSTGPDTADQVLVDWFNKIA